MNIDRSLLAAIAADRANLPAWVEFPAWGKTAQAGVPQRRVSLVSWLAAPDFLTVYEAAFLCGLSENFIKQHFSAHIADGKVAKSVLRDWMDQVAKLLTEPNAEEDVIWLDPRSRTLKDLKYILIETDSSCANCSSKVELLCPQETEDMHSNPAFYICWSCHYIGQVSVGTVVRPAMSADPDAG